jgi:alpha-glucoside transport system substrate-binding protein
MKKKRLFLTVLSLILVSGFVLGACTPTATPTEASMDEETEEVVTEEPEVEETEEPTEEMVEALPQGEELANAYAGMYAGTVVTMAGPFTDQDEVVFNDSIAPFEEATGIDIQYEGSKEFEASINIRLDAGDAPDIVDYPQPGLLATAVEKGYPLDVRDVINPEWLQENYSDAWLNLATMEGPDGEDFMAGIWARANGKSLVFYPKAQFDAAGYVVPTTWDELMALTDQIASDGDTPWCIGIESGAATGWTMTDWMEDTLLRVAPPEVYDDWVAGDVKFDSPEVNLALDYIDQIWMNDDYVYGGTAAISTIAFGDAPKPMFESPPQCWLHRQGNFITTFFPEEMEAGVDYDFFYFPPIDEEYGRPVLGAGDIYAMFNDRPEVRAVMQYFSTGESLKVWIESGGAIGVQNDVDLDWYADPVTRGVAEIISQATTFRFDASDLMPAAVGQGTFWKYMTDYVSGAVDRETALQEIDASWPAE